NYRDHRKIACVDGDVCYTGGVNIADEYANLITRFGYWKDTGVRLEGEGSWGLTKTFLEMLTLLGGATRHELDYYRPRDDMRAEGWCQPFTDGPRNNPDNPAEDVYFQLITNAKRFLYLTTPYFIPDENILRALCVAGDGGVDVRLMLPAIPDHHYTDLVADSYVGELLEHGVKVYRYTPGFLHQKCVMVDREVAVVGSVNMDYRSFELHYECGVVLYGCPMIEDLLEDMDDIVEKSHLVTPEEWQRRKWYHRLAEPLLRLFAIWM
ncbi:MAG: cardiolipin synthase, partial [Ruminococcaceae bacterium]|nr:cardiolipin synthase [Oscillospiraceae bacterium]